MQRKLFFTSILFSLTTISLAQTVLPCYGADSDLEKDLKQRQNIVSEQLRVHQRTNEMSKSVGGEGKAPTLIEAISDREKWGKVFGLSEIEELELDHAKEINALGNKAKHKW